MSAAIIPLRRSLPRLPFCGTVVVMGSKETGFQVGHESRSGNSWGHFSGPYSNGVDAISAALALNRDEYNGGCDVAICDDALADRDGVTSRPPTDREDF
ncbi:hypothetical protein [Sphingomonas beigongshangi]|uniref:hypothetical protein n=1 Tax=Sphingomonas beigongshangi TaxID=2782540 RepID=UPI00193BD8F1|nr:hypothetical protein [Sphingomonas beigongshangi]